MSPGSGFEEGGALCALPGPMAGRLPRGVAELSIHDWQFYAKLVPACFVVSGVVPSRTHDVRNAPID